MTRTIPSILAFACLLALCARPIAAQAERYQGGFTSFESSRLTKPKRVGVLRSVVEIPPDVDATSFVDYLCVYSAHDAPQGGQLPNVKATYQSEVYIVDHRVGTFETYPLDSGVMRTTQLGFVRASIEIPEAVKAEIFTDGFESGDVAAFLVTHATPRKGKKLVQTQLRCDFQQE